MPSHLAVYDFQTSQISRSTGNLEINVKKNLEILVKTGR